MAGLSWHGHLAHDPERVPRQRRGMPRGNGFFCREGYSPSPSRAREPLDIPRGTRGGTGRWRYMCLSACSAQSAVPPSAAGN